MLWAQNPDEFFSKPLTVYPMTNPIPQTPEPPAAGELSDEQLLQMAADAQIYKFQATAGDPVQYEPTEPQLIAYVRAAIAADRARRPQQEEMAEALRRLRRWGGLVRNCAELTTRHNCDVVLGVCDWIDAGMIGPLPPLPDRIVARQGEQPPVDETTTIKHTTP